MIKSQLNVNNNKAIFWYFDSRVGRKKIGQDADFELMLKTSL